MLPRISFTLVFLLSFCLSSFGQLTMKDTFTDYSAHSRYVISGYFVQTKAELSLLQIPPTGFYVTSLQMHNDWKYLTNSFALEALSQQKYMNKTDSMNLALVSLISAKDTMITALREKQQVQELFQKSEREILIGERTKFQSAFNTCAEGNAALSLQLDRERDKKKNWMALSIGGVFVGFLLGVFAF